MVHRKESFLAKDKNKQYEVLQFVKQGNRARIVSTQVEGILLVHKMEHKDWNKVLLLHVFQQVLEQLVLFEQYSKETQYRYICPYSIVYTSTGEVMLLNLEEESSQFAMRYLQQREVRDYFIVYPVLNAEKEITHQAMYNFGKTLEFFLTHCEFEIPYTSREEKKIYALIEACSPSSGRQAYQTMIEVKQAFPSPSKLSNSPISRKYSSTLKKLGIVAAILVVAFIVKSQLTGIAGNNDLTKVHANDELDELDAAEEIVAYICDLCIERAGKEDRYHEELNQSIQTLHEALANSTSELREEIQLFFEGSGMESEVEEILEMANPDAILELLEQEGFAGDHE